MATWLIQVAIYFFIVSQRIVSYFVSTKLSQISMDIDVVPYSKIPFLSRTDLAYLEQRSELMQFSAWPANLDIFADVIAKRGSQPQLDRKILVEVIFEQYRTINTTESVKANILSLADARTFTVCTAHQPTLFTGPLYVIYKIASCINLANQLQLNYPAYRFVPVYVMGGEDHDFDEINHLNIWEQKISWDHLGRGNATGRLSTEGIKSVWNEVYTLLDTKLPAHKLQEIFAESFTPALTYGEGNQRFINHLFKTFGLVTVSMDHRALKKAFQQIMADDLVNHTSAALVRDTQTQLSQAGYSAQALVREVNLFMFKNGLRQRIDVSGGQFEVGGVNIPAADMMAHLQEHPEDFSPNVVLRPLFQEFVLPNLAYIGGGGEIAYWLERKAQFAHYAIPYPVLIRRNSAAIIDRTHYQALIKSGLHWSEICVPDIETLLSQRAAAGLELNISSHVAFINSMYDKLSIQSLNIDPTLQPFILAEKTKSINGLIQIEKKAIKAEKAKQEVFNNRVRKVYFKLFPTHNLQERVENFLPYYLEYGDTLINQLVTTMDPFRREFLFYADKE